MIVGAHPDFARVALVFHSFERFRDGERVGRFRLVHRLGEHLELGLRGVVVKILLNLLVSLVVGVVEFLDLVVGDVRMPCQHLRDMVRTGRADRTGCAGVVRIDRVVGNVQAGVLARLDQQREVRAPVAGDDRLRAGCLDLGDIRREILDLAKRVQVIADDFDVGPFPGQHFPSGPADCLAKSVILVQQVNLLDVLAAGDVVGHRFDLHVDVGVEAEMPEIAFLVGQRRVLCGEVEVQDGLVRVPLVVLGDGLGQGMGVVRARALRQIADAPVGGLLEHEDAFLRAGFVVQVHDLELDAALGVGLGRSGCQMMGEAFSDQRKRPAQRVDVGDLDGLRGKNRDLAAERKHYAENAGQTRLAHGALLVWTLIL